jgi:hypothetical protein
MSRFTIALVFSAALVGCTTGQGVTPLLTQGEVPRGCPLGVAGATVHAEDTADGIALSFVSRERPNEMRRRANDAAAQHGPDQRAGEGHGGKHGEGGTHGLQLMQAPPAYSSADDIENGSRIRFVPAAAADTDVLRAKLRERADRLNVASCR